MSFFLITATKSVFFYIDLVMDCLITVTKCDENSLIWSWFFNHNHKKRRPFGLLSYEVMLLCLLFHNELNSVFKAVSLNCSKVDAAVEAADVDVLFADAKSSVNILFHDFLASDVVDADVHF